MQKQDRIRRPRAFIDIGQPQRLAAGEGDLGIVGREIEIGEIFESFIGRTQYGHGQVSSRVA